MTMPDPPCGPLHLSNFSGVGSEAKSWYINFNLLVSKYECDDAEKCQQLGFHHNGNAAVFLPYPKKILGLGYLKPAFGQQFPDNEPAHGGIFCSKIIILQLSTKC